MKTWQCHGRANQKWVRAEDGSIRNPQNGMCLDIMGPSEANGAALHLWGCHGGWSQKWSFEGDATIRSSKGKCVEIHGWGRETARQSRRGSARPLSIWNQKWTTWWVDGRVLRPDLNRSALRQGTAVHGGISGGGLGDRSGDTEPRAVTVIIDGQHTSGCRRRSSDLGNALPLYGSKHALRQVLPASPGGHEVCVTVFNYAHGWAGHGVGCKTVTVS